MMRLGSGVTGLMVSVYFILSFSVLTYFYSILIGFAKIRHFAIRIADWNKIIPRGFTIGGFCVYIMEKLLDVTGKADGITDTAITIIIYLRISSCAVYFNIFCFFRTIIRCRPIKSPFFIGFMKIITLS